MAAREADAALLARSEYPGATAEARGFADRRLIISSLFAGQGSRIDELMKRRPPDAPNAERGPRRV